MAHTYEYPRPAVCADCVLFGWRADDLQLLLIQRAHDPFSGSWALPGGFMDMDETVSATAHRELQEETGLSDVPLAELGCWSGVHRDPRGRTVSIAYWGLVAADSVDPVAADDAQAAVWQSVFALPPLAFDHAEIVATALRRLLSAIEVSPSQLGLPAAVRARLTSQTLNFLQETRT